MKPEKSKYPIGGYAPGNYSGTCTTCKKEFMGDKRAVQCEPCAISMIEKHELKKKEVASNKSTERTSFDEAIDIISGMLDDSYCPEDSNNDETRFNVNQAIWCLQNGYLLVEFPDVQQFMDEDWFEEEAIFCGGSEEKTGSSAYFVPIKYLI